MREIKFRGYAVQKMVGSQWLYGFGVDPIEYAEEYAKEIGRKRDWYLYTDSGPIHVHEKSIGQYTGLKDKNGMEIYEGDGYFIGTEFRYVGFEDGIFFSYKKNGTQQESLYYCLSLGVEIIGNIYENPELLEQQS